MRNQYYTDSTGNEVSLLELENDDMDTSSIDEYEAKYSYHYDCIIKEMFANPNRVSYSVQELDLLVKQRMGE